MRKFALRLALATALLLSLTGCFFKTTEELFVLPALPEDYTELQSKLNEVTSALGADSISPLLGANTANVQLQDLDTGAGPCAIAFFQVSGAEHPLKIYIFSQDEEGGYDVAYILEGDGTAINTISYIDINGDGPREIVVSWQLSAKVHVLEVFSLSGATAATIMRASYSDQYALLDLDQDGQREILILQTDESGESPGQVDYYDYDGESFSMVLRAGASLSAGIASISSVTTGYLADNIPALYVVSALDSGTITDIFAIREGQFTNILLDPETGTSPEVFTYSTDVAAADINSDAILELPMPQAIPEYSSAAQAPNFLAIRWRQYSLEGAARPVCTTYHNVSDGWYLVMPEEWEGQITLSRDDSRASRGERSVVFSQWDGSEGATPQAFLTITKLTSTNRSYRRGNAFVLYEDSSATYLAEFSSTGWDCGLTEETLKASFHLITSGWS